MTDSAIKQRRILTVDDNVYTLGILKHILEQADFQVLMATSGEEALETIMQWGLPHLAIVDFHMPGGMSGFEFCRTIHRFSDLSVIILTAVDKEAIIVEGLEQHAEDYIIKPFNPTELVARVQRLLRRIGNFAYPLMPITRVDSRLLVNFPKCQAIVDGEAISLTPTEARLLYVLIRNAGQTVNTDFILRRMWPLEEACEDRLHVHLHRLRRKIEGKSPDPYIVSDRGMGYIFQSG